MTVLLLLLWQIPPLEVATGATFTWDHSGFMTDRFEVRIDARPWIDNRMTTFWTLPTNVTGDHTIYVRACKGTACSSSATLRVLIAGAPPPPTNLRPTTPPPF